MDSSDRSGLSPLEVLRCTQCNAPIPFADDETTTCPFCRTENKVPPAYREMRAAKSLDTSARHEADRVLRKLDRPAWMVTKVLARVLDLPFLAFWFLYGIPVGLYSVIKGMKISGWIGHHWMGVPQGKDEPYWLFIACIFGLLFVILFIPRVLGVMANRRITDRVRLLAALAAKPPRTAGGPASCRSCGAPLFVETDALIARCAYCGTDNAVQLRTKVASAALKGASHLAATVMEAAKTDRANRRRTRVLLLKELWRYLWPLAIFGVLFGMGDSFGPWPSVICGLFLIGFFIYALARSGKTDDAQDRRSGNDAPEWITYVGPFVVLFLMWFYSAHC
jgi:uncharacterized Zn finger protein (UPF0148 family)